MKKSLLILAVGSILSSCQKNQSKDNHDFVIAQVYEAQLKQSDINEVIPQGTAPEDSILMSRSYINSWVTKQLLLKKATQNLSSINDEIRRQVEEYRVSLLIHTYKQQLIEQKLQQEISQSEIENYYNTTKYNFILSTPIAKAQFIILPKNAPDLELAKKWFISDEDTDKELLEGYSLTNAKKYDNFQDNWIEIKNLMSLLPIQYADKEKQLIKDKYLEAEDESYIYLLSLTEFRKEHAVSPLSHVKDEITLILKNKRKLRFENELEREIFKEAQEKEIVKYY